MGFKVPLKVTEIQLVYKNEVRAKDRPIVMSSQDAYWVFESNWSEQMGLVEEFNIMLLDRSSRVMSLCNVSKGGITSTIVDLKIVFAAALKGRANSIILAHNHPSCNLRPSQADIELTRKFDQAGKLLGIQVLDHLILSPEGGYYSFGDNLQMGR
ncbi:MAG: JAB domain-containing protein [Bacteroidota bacterium]